MGWIIVHLLLLRMLCVFSMKDPQESDESESSDSWKPEEISYKKYDLHTVTKFLKSGINKNVNPCNNFYEYVCGKWAENNKNPDGYGTWDTHKITQYNIISTMREILENQTSHMDNLKLSKEKKLYETCMDTSLSRIKGQNLFLRMFNETTAARWQNVAKYYASEVGEIPFFHITLNEENVLQIVRPRKAETNKKAYTYMNEQKLIININKFIMLTKNLSDHYWMKEQKVFMRSINKIVYDEDSELEKTSISNLQTLYNDYILSSNGKISWIKLLNKFAEGTGMEINSSDEILVDLKYLKQLSEVLSETQERTIIDYLHYNFIMDSSTLGSINLVINEWSPNQRSTHCINKMPAHKGLNDELVDYYVPHENQEMINDMFEAVKDELVTEMKNSWFEGDAKDFVIDKVNEIKLKFNTAHNALEWEEPETISYDFETGPVALQNIINFKKAQTIYKIKMYVKNHNQRRSRRGIDINLFYNPNSNYIQINPGLIIAPFFHLEAPMAYNYGMLGFLIGHEISHSFDFSNTEHFFATADLSAHLENPIFEKNRQCFEKQFKKEFNQDGAMTLDENVADTEGLKLAFKAMERYFEDDPTDRGKKLPGLEYITAEKLFFISFANQWCTSNHRHNTLHEDDIHAPYHFRVTGSLMNMNEFAKTFNCSSGVYMNPKEKCNMWQSIN